MKRRAVKCVCSNRAVPGSSADCRSTVASGLFGPLAIGGIPFFPPAPPGPCTGTYATNFRRSDTRGHSAEGLAADGR